MLRIKVRGANHGDVYTEGWCAGLRIPEGGFLNEIYCEIIDKDGSGRNSTYYFTDVDELGIHKEHRFKYSLLIEKVCQ